MTHAELMSIIDKFDPLYDDWEKMKVLMKDDFYTVILSRYTGKPEIRCNSCRADIQCNAYHLNKCLSKRSILSNKMRDFFDLIRLLERI